MPNRRLTHRRGEIWWTNLEPTVGDEAGKERPCLILQNDRGSKNSSITVVAPLLRGAKTYPFTVNASPTAQNGIKGQRHINLSQIRVVDVQRIKNKQNTLEDFYWDAVERAILIELGFNPAFSNL